MIKCVTLALLAALAPVKEPTKLERIEPAIPGKTIVRSVDGDYRIEGESNTKSTYESLKAALDERFSAMFELKEKLDKLQNDACKMQEEYYALNAAYNRELKKIIAAYVTESNYGESEPVPQPRIRLYR
ncbi:MAG: hypothetical protein K2M95_06995 [Clostridiales bacterium]|nr:hypothetical protein [Clostridiales bacterium]